LSRNPRFERAPKIKCKARLKPGFFFVVPIDVNEYRVQIFFMKISVTDAKGQLTELVRRAEGGEEIILTRHGHPAARLMSMMKSLTADDRAKLLEDIRSEGRAKAAPGPGAARSQDFLYGDDGL